MPIVAITSLDLPAALAPLKTIDHSGDLTDPIEKGGAVMGPTSKKGVSKVDRKTLTKLARNWQAPPISLDAPMHNIQIPVSIGELVDKLTSLEIKLEQLQGEARQNVEGELDLLQEVLVASGLAIDPELWQQLAAINRSLWRIGDIRELERLGVPQQQPPRPAQAPDQRAAWLPDRGGEGLRALLSGWEPERPT